MFRYLCRSVLITLLAVSLIAVPIPATPAPPPDGKVPSADEIFSFCVIDRLRCEQSFIHAMESDPTLKTEAAMCMGLTVCFRRFSQCLAKLLPPETKKERAVQDHLPQLR